jgi:rare lipoprotein A
MLILGLMWVASWFSGIPSLGNTLIEAPKFLSSVLSRSAATSSSESRSLPLQALLSTVRDASSFNLTAPSSRLPAQSRSVASASPHWVATIEHLLLTPDSDNALSETNSEPVALTVPENRPLSHLFDTVQNLFGELPIVKSEPTAAVVIVESGFESTFLDPKRDLLKRFGFWQCPNWQSSPSEHTAMGGFQIWVKGCQIAKVPDRVTAEILRDRFQKLLDTPNLSTAQLQNALIIDRPGAKLGDQILFTVDQNLAKWLSRPAELVAIEWLNNLRLAIGQSALDLAEAQIQMYQLKATSDSIGGMASWYGPYFHGRQTANGEIYNQYELTAAHPTLPLGTYLKVTNRLNQKSLVVRVNDRGPYFDNRVLDLSKRAARLLDSEDKGVVPIEAVVMQPSSIQESVPPQKIARLVIGY